MEVRILSEIPKTGFLATWLKYQFGTFAQTNEVPLLSDVCLLLQSMLKLIALNKCPVTECRISFDRSISLMEHH